MTRLQLIGVMFFARLGFGFQSTPVNPVPTYRPEPKYTEEGRKAHIQGIVLLQLVVDEQGRPTQITVLSPLGYGLDEAAIDAVAHWRFKPGTKDGTPVRITAQVETTFRFDNESFDPKAEKQRTDFNVALHAVQKGTPNSATVGRGVTRDPVQGFRLIQEAADKKYGPAIYEIAVERLEGKRLDKDPTKGMELMRSAARLGSRGAQSLLGEAYEKGAGVTADIDKSRQYFRLCAADGDSACQFRLGKSLIEHSEAGGRDYVQAIAWLQLASDHGIGDAERILQKEDEHVTPAQLKAARQLMTQLVHAQ